MLNIAVLVSGGGTNLQALIDAQNRGEIINGRITCVISSKPGVYALERAERRIFRRRSLRAVNIRTFVPILPQSPRNC